MQLINGLTVRYSLTRVEIVRTYFFALSRSPRIALVVLIICAWPGIVHAATHFSHLNAADFLYALAVAVCVFFVLLGWVFLRAKTSERILTISDQGIYTEIGTKKGTYPWTKIRQVKDVGHHIIVVGRSGNAFFIPQRAFSDSAAKTAFLAAVNQARNAKAQN